MKKSYPVVLTVVVALVTSLGATWIANLGTSPAQPVRESAYDRVMRTKTLRCGYVVYAPAFMKDPNTGAFSGIIYDITELMAKRIGLKLDWAEEVSFGGMIEGLKAGRYDALCINGWNSGGYSPFLSQTIPLYYSAIDAYTWEGNERFDNNLAAANDHAVKISTIDGTATKVIADQNFSKASQLTMPQTTDYIIALVNVGERKADLTFVERSLASKFMAKNPGKIRKVKLDKPLRYYANGLDMDIGEHKLLAMFNMTLEEMLGSGDIDAILARYPDNPPSSLPIAKPFSD
jgi:ABC-type amino acid transport substrate-binding protein